MRTNTYFTRKVYIDEVDSPPGAGRGLYALTPLKKFDIIGIYTGGEKLTPKDISSPHDTTYTATYESIIRDGLNHKTGRVTCDVAMINDSLDPSLHNCDFYIHPDYPDHLLVIATKDIPLDRQIFLAYGADYWCHDKYPLTVHIAAITCYNINIALSPQWQALHNYQALCAHFHINVNTTSTTANTNQTHSSVIDNSSVTIAPSRETTQQTTHLFNTIPVLPTIPTHQTKTYTKPRKRKRTVNHNTGIGTSSKQQRINWPQLPRPRDPATGQDECAALHTETPASPPILVSHRNVDIKNSVNIAATAMHVDLAGTTQFISSDSPLIFPFNLLAAAEHTTIAPGMSSPNLPTTLSYDKHVVDS